MKSKRLHIFILSIYVLITCSGLMFYRSVVKFDNLNSSIDFDLEDLKTIDLQTNMDFHFFKNHPNEENLQLKQNFLRLKEIVNIIKSSKVDSPNLHKELADVTFNFKNKIDALESSIKLIKQNNQILNQTNNSLFELEKLKLKELKDNKTIIYLSAFHAANFFAIPSNFNKNLLEEDLKILSQIVTFSSTPNPTLIAFYNNMQIILANTQTIELNNKVIQIDSSYQKLSRTKNLIANFQTSKKNKERYLLYIIFITIFIYIIALMSIIRKSKKIYITLR